MTNDLAFTTFEEAAQVAKVLLNNNYVCMLSLEDDLVILSHEWEEYCNRNGIIFRSLEDWEYERDKECEKCCEDHTGDCHND